MHLKMYSLRVCWANGVEIGDLPDGAKIVCADHLIVCADHLIVCADLRRYSLDS